MTSELKQMSESLHHVDLSRACFRWKQVSWTQALRTIVKNCYKQHGREDLLYAFEDHITTQHITTTTTHSIAHLVPSQTVVQTISNPDGTVSLIQVSSGPSCGNSYTVVFHCDINYLHWRTSLLLTSSGLPSVLNLVVSNALKILNCTRKS